LGGTQENIRGGFGWQVFPRNQCRKEAADFKRVHNFTDVLQHGGGGDGLPGAETGKVGKPILNAREKPGFFCQLLAEQRFF